MTETKTRRDWIKNVAIIFLSVLLVLTFFSGTIQNYSLPEVAVQYTTSDTVSSGIRTSGTVNASKSYNITVDETRTVAEVLVRNGDEVAAGDTLLVLADEESEELTAAREQLKNLQTAYEKTLLSLTKGDTSAETAAVTAAQAAYDRAVSNMDAYKASVASTAEQKAVDTAVRNLESLKLWHGDSYTDGAGVSPETAIAYYAAYIGIAENDLFIVPSPTVPTVANVTQPESSSTPDSSTPESSTPESSTPESSTPESSTPESSTPESSTPESSTPESSTPDGSTPDGSTPDGSTPDGSTPDSSTPDGSTPDSSTPDSSTPDGSTPDSSTPDNPVTPPATAPIDKSFANLKPEYASYYGVVLKTASAELEAAKWNLSTAGARYQDEIDAARRALESAKKALADRQADLTTDDKLNNIELQQQKDAITKQQALITELQTKYTDAVITAKQAGTVSNLIAAAGEKVMAGDTVCTIQLIDTGYTADISLSAAQAQRVQVGSMASVSGYYWGQQPRATVTSIRNDPNVRGNRLITLSVTGDVEPGGTYTFVLGETSSSYDIVVPKSAVREDNTGTFVLIVTNKSTPLGTRYYITRVDVTILASDDTRCAVSGEFTGWDYVVTSSSAPIQAGDQVRLANS